MASCAFSGQAPGPNNRGRFSCTIDGGTSRTGTSYAATSIGEAACIGVTGLSNGSHTLKVTRTGGTYFTLDALNVDVNPCTGEQMLEPSIDGETL